jgi:hypothetical protein
LTEDEQGDLGLASFFQRSGREGRCSRGFGGRQVRRHCRIGVALIALEVFCLLFGAAAAQAVTTYANAGEFGRGALLHPKKIAVDEATGNVLVADAGSNRVQVYSAGGPSAALVTSFGEGELANANSIAVDQSNGDVYVTSAEENEIQTLEIAHATGGTFTLGFGGQSTAPLPYNANSQTIEAALEGLSTFGAGNVLIREEGSFDQLAFQGELGGRNLEQLSIDDSGLEGESGGDAPSGKVATLRQGFDGKLFKFVPNNRAHPSAYVKDPTFVSPAPGHKSGQVGSFASSIAVDPQTGSLLVADSSNGRISRFTPSGTFVSSFNGAGSPSGVFESLLDIAVAPNGQIYVVRDGSVGESENVSGASVERFESDGSGGTAIGEAGEFASARSLAFEPRTGNLIVAWGGAYGSPAPQLSVYHDGTLVERASYPERNRENVPIGLAVDGGASGRLYAATDALSGQSENAVQVFNPISVPVIALPSEIKVIGIDLASAHLTGTVEPAGKELEYHFEYSADGGSSWTATPTMDAGSGNGPVQVEADLLGLSVDTSYLVRLASSSYEVSTVSAPEQFSTPRLPIIATSRADYLSSTSVVAHGLLDPFSLAVTSSFEYGTTTEYGSQTPVAAVGAGDALVSVLQPITGLQPATTYHYRLRVDSIGGEAFGEDKVFTTLATPRPLSARPTEQRSAPVDPGPAGRRCGRHRHLQKAKGRSRCVKTAGKGHRRGHGKGPEQRKQ